MKFWIGIILLSLIVSELAFSQEISGKFVPPGGKMLLIIGQDRESIDTYSKETNTVPAGVMFYTALKTLTGLDEPVDYGSGFQDAAYLLKEYPDSVLQIGLYLVGDLEKILGGEMDANIQTFGEWLKNTGRPVYLRIGYEFDLPQNNYEPEAYKKAFRYLVTRWRQQGVANVAFVWHSYGVSKTEKPFINWYPGDDVVDWFAASFFDAYNRNDVVKFASLAAEHKKPFMLAETSPTKNAPAESAKKWDHWYKIYFDLAAQSGAQAICYINNDWESFSMWRGQGWGDSRVEADPVIKSRWLNEISSPRYLKTSTGLFRELGYGHN